MICRNRTQKSLFYLSAVNACLVTLAISGCKTIPTESFSESAEPASEIAKTEERLLDAHSRQVNVTAPKNYRDARDHSKKAKANLNDNDDRADILQEVGLANAYLKQANEADAKTSVLISEVLSARRFALDAKADSLASNALLEADLELTNVTGGVEGSDKPEIPLVQRDSLKDRYMATELTAIKSEKLGNARLTLNQAINEGAKNIAPLSLVKAENSLQEAEATIEANRRDQALITNISEKAAAATNKLLTVTREAKLIGGANAEVAVLEKIRLQEELAASKATTESMSGRLSTITNESEKSQERNKSLSSKLAFNERFTVAAAMFGTSEAEVYREGNSLVMRLKELSFAPGKADLKSENYSILNRVRDVANSFAPASVTIEGHTDSTGSEAINAKLSTERAEAVLAYMQQNGLSSAGIKANAKGFGASKPLAPNNTAQGRSMNRRVDVIVNPEMPSTSH